MRISVKSLSDALHRRLSRITSTNRFVPEIDGLRFVAIVTVLAYHINGYFVHHAPATIVVGASRDWLASVLNQGHYGVELFFVISGFILGLPFAEQYLASGRTVVIKKYFLRRLTRIEPPYLIAIMIYFALIVLSGKASFERLWPHLLAQLAYLNFAIFHDIPQVCFVAWSLEVEVQFYIFAPVLAMIFRLRSPLWRRTALLAVMILSSALPAVPNLGANLLTFLPYFMAGFLLTDVYLINWRERPPRNHLWDLVGAFSWVGLLVIFLTNFLVNSTAPLLIFTVCASAFRGKIWNGIFTQRWVITFGGMCYTTYLYHPLIKSFCAKLTVKFLVTTSFYWPNILLQIFLLIPIIFMVSAVPFILIERPCMQPDWPQRFAAAASNLLLAAIGKRHS